jgi:RNA polymerase sigma-70 factor (ECF subfamily)
MSLMWQVRGLLGHDLTFGPRLATLLCVEPEPFLLGPGGDESQIADYVRRAQGGDPEGYKQLFRLHVQRLHRLVRRLAGPGCDTEDLVQTIFVQAFRALPGFRGDSAFFTWLGRIAIRITLRQSRHGRPWTLPLDEATAGSGAGAVEGAADARRALARFDAILAGLSDKRRTAFVLHVLQGHSLEEVAAMVSARVGAVKVRVHDARVEIERQARRDPYLAHYLQWEMTP